MLKENFPHLAQIGHFSITKEVAKKATSLAYNHSRQFSFKNCFSFTRRQYICFYLTENSKRVLKKGLARISRDEDEFVYDILAVPSFEDALIAVKLTHIPNPVRPGD